MNKKTSNSVTLSQREMSPSTEKREEIRGSEGEASPPTRVREKTEVTHSKMLPHNQRERGLKESS